MNPILSHGADFILFDDEDDYIPEDYYNHNQLERQILASYTFPSRPISYNAPDVFLPGATPFDPTIDFGDLSVQFEPLFRDMSEQDSTPEPPGESSSGPIMDNEIPNIIPPGATPFDPTIDFTVPDAQWEPLFQDSDQSTQYGGSTLNSVPLDTNLPASSSTVVADTAGVAQTVESSDQSHHASDSVSSNERAQPRALRLCNKCARAMSGVNQPQSDPNHDGAPISGRAFQSASISQDEIQETIGTNGGLNVNEYHGETEPPSASAHQGNEMVHHYITEALASSTRTILHPSNLSHGQRPPLTREPGYAPGQGTHSYSYSESPEYSNSGAVVVPSQNDTNEPGINFPASFNLNGDNYPEMIVHEGLNLGSIPPFDVKRNELLAIIIPSMQRQLNPIPLPTAPEAASAVKRAAAAAYTVLQGIHSLNEQAILLEGELQILVNQDLRPELESIQGRTFFNQIFDFLKDLFSSCTNLLEEANLVLEAMVHVRFHLEAGGVNAQAYNKQFINVVTERIENCLKVLKTINLRVIRRMWAVIGGWGEGLEVVGGIGRFLRGPPFNDQLHVYMGRFVSIYGPEDTSSIGRRG